MKDEIDRYLDEAPESKLELIDGQLVVGNSLLGSRYTLWEIVSGWGADAALAFAPLGLWWEALAAAFPDGPAASAPQVWQAWAAQVREQPEIAPTGPRAHAEHNGAYSRLSLDLYRAVGQGNFGHSLGRDFVMRLGNDAFTPDLLLLERRRLAALHEYYIDGPADLVIEIFIPGHEAQDRDIKRRLYLAGGVPEYWLVNPATRSVVFLRLADAGYHLCLPDDDGRYRSASVPGLAFVPARLWEEERRSALDPGAFEVETPWPPIKKPDRPKHDLGWGSLPFAPSVALTRSLIRFEEFISWCPEAKFEGSDGRPIIAGRHGTRNVLGMLLMTFGLVEAVKVLPPSTWVSALIATEQAHQRDATRKAEWWALARRAAALLREQHRYERLAVIGDLVRSEPLGRWSEITLVAWDVPEGNDLSMWRALWKLSDEPPIDLLDADHASPARRQEIEQEAIEL